MNVLNVISEIEKHDPEIYGRLDTRRNVMKDFGRMAGKITLASLPLALGSMFKKAYGQTNSTVTEILNFALTLEYLEAEFYNTALDSASPVSGMFPNDAAKGAFQTLAAHENAHVALLKGALGGDAVAKPTFDFTAGNGSGTGPLSGNNSPFKNYAVLLAVAQTYEDTGVRAYKGQAEGLISNNDVLTIALQIHSVEARHAAHIRQMRRALDAAIPAGVTVKPWITLKQSGIADPFAQYVQASYDGEELTNQAGLDITAFANAEAASEAFDEPLTMAQVFAIVDPFIAP
jgi:rubrerythrin